MEGQVIMTTTLVNFLLINSSALSIDMFSYTEDIMKVLFKKGLITQFSISDARADFGDGTCIVEIVDTIYTSEYIYIKGEEKTHWQLIFEFGTFTSSSQLQIKINSNDYDVKVADNYLEQLKLSIKNIVKSDWERTIWLMDKDSEILSITLYPSVYRVENMTRQLISEIMTKEYGIGWWDAYVPIQIRNKHKVRLSGYKSIAPGFANVDERLMSIDIGDLNSILTLKEKKWNPSFSTEINNFLNNQSDIKLEKMKEVLSDQMEVTLDLWGEQFSKYLSEDFIKNFKTFELNRNHVVHNKLIDRTAYSSIFNSINIVEVELKKALQKVGEIVVSREQRDAIEEQMYIAQQESEAALHEIMESETGVEIRNSEEIIDLYDEYLYQFHSELQDYLRFRNDLEVGEYQNILSKNNAGTLFEITYKINDKVAIVSYSIESIDDSQGGESTVEIIITLDEKSESHSITYRNGEVVFNSYQGCYLPETQDAISTEDIGLLKDYLVEFLDTYFENIREKVDSEMYSIIKDGGNSPVADISCCECGEEYICVDENYGVFGQCLNCGEMNEICLCDRCGCYFEGESNEYRDAPNLCDSCQDYYENQ